jgi:CRP-like cAMP-binding protein
LAALPPKDFSIIASDLKDISLDQGLVLQEAGEPVEHVYFPQTGMISLLAVMQDGREVETATIGREGGVGTITGLGSRISPHTGRSCKSKGVPRASQSRDLKRQ